MEVPKIEDAKLNVEMNESEQRDKVGEAEEARRKCIYDKKTECAAPNCDKKICEKCPYATPFSLAATMKDVFGKIVSIAIYLAKSDDVMRDVIAMMSKSKEGENSAKSQDPSPKAQFPSHKAEAGNEILEENIEQFERTELHIKKAAIAERPAAKKVAGIQTKMAADVAKKVASIEDALANSGGSPERPLV